MLAGSWLHSTLSVNAFICYQENETCHKKIKIMKINHSFLSSASSSTRLTKKTQVWLLAGIVTLALIFRLIFLYAFHDDYFQAGVIVANGELARQVVSNHRLAMNAEYMKEIQARQAASGKLLDVKDWPPEPDNSEAGPPSVSDAPGYSILLALTWWIFGKKSYIYLQFIQLILDSVMCLLVFWVGKKLFSASAGLIAALLFVLYIPEARLAVSPHRDVWANFFVFGSLAFYYLVLRKESWQRAQMFVLYGLCFGLISWVRPTIILFPLVALPSFIGQLGWKKTLGYGLTTYALVLVIFLFPFFYYNHSQYNRLLAGPLPLLMWNGIKEYENNWNVVSLDDHAQEYAQTKGSFPVEPFQPEFHEILALEVKEVIRENPAWYAGTLLKRIPRLLTLRNSRGDFHRIFNPDDRLWDGRPTLIKHLLTFPPLAFLGKSLNKIISTLMSGNFLLIIFAAGLIIYRKKAKLLLPLILTVFYFALVFSPFLVQGRFVMPMIFSYLILYSAVIMYGLRVFYVGLQILKGRKNHASE